MAMMMIESMMSFWAAIVNEPSLLEAIPRYNWSQLDWRKADSFKWESGVTPLSSLKLIVTTWIVYWTVILVLKQVMKTREPFSLKWVAAGHNLILMVWSLIMFVGVVLACIDQHAKFGPRSLFCAGSEAQLHSRMYYWLFIFYVSKFYELFDTVILILKKRDLIFLHWYHHSVVIMMTWSWCNSSVNFACLGMLANCLVHVFMYTYYLCAALKIKVWFKKYITTIQILQFAVSFVLSVMFWVYAADGTYCHGADSYSVEFSVACNISFFCLFSWFYWVNYKKGGDDGGKKDI